MRKSLIALALVLGCAGSVRAMEVMTLPDTGLRLQVYGYIKADLSHDTQNTAPGSDFTFYVLSGEKDGQTRLAARESRFGLNLFGPDAAKWKTTGKIEMDFYGGGNANSYNPRMRLAYVDMAHSCGLSFRFGQDWDTFTEVTPRINNFAYLADVGALGLRRPQARATQEIKIGDNTKIVVKVAAAQTVGQDLDGAGQDDGADADWPTAQWNVALHQQLWVEKKMARLAFSGHYGQETVDGASKSATTNALGVVTESTRVTAVDQTDYDTWSVQGSIFLPLCKMSAIQANIWQGENLDTFYGAIGQGVNTSLGKEIEATGGFVQLLFDPTEKWSFGLGYAVDDPEDEDLVGNKTQMSKNDLIWFYGAYKFTAALTAIAEYSQMTTDYLGKDDATNDRVQVSMKYTF
jgi:hypothetical protein